MTYFQQGGDLILKRLLRGASLCTIETHVFWKYIASISSFYACMMRFSAEINFRITKGDFPASTGAVLIGDLNAPGGVNIYSGTLGSARKLGGS